MMRSLVVALALVVTACGSSSITAPLPTPETITGRYVRDVLPPRALADTLTITPDGTTAEKMVYPIDGGSYTRVATGTYQYDATTHVMTWTTTGTTSEWSYTGQALTHSGTSFIKITR